MAKSKRKEYIESLAHTPIRFSPYAVLKTGLITSQTVLKIEDYMLICSPYELSMQKAILLLILSEEETRFFRQYRGDTCALSLTFLKHGSLSPVNIELKSKISRIGPVKNRPNLCLIDIDFSEQPAQLIEILGDYILAHSALRTYYENFAGREIVIDEQMARMLRFNDYMECTFGQTKVNAQLTAISVNSLVFDVPAGTEDVIEGFAFSCKLYFQLYQFTVQGTIQEVEGYGTKSMRVRASIAFAPELIEIMDDYFYRLTHAVANGVPSPVGRREL